MANDVLRFGGTQIGTELVFALPEIVRLTPPIEEEGAMNDVATLLEVGTNLIHRVHCVVFYEAADQYAFARWMIQMARLMKSARKDVVVVPASGTGITWPRCVFVSFERPAPSSQAEARFSAAIGLNFVTDEEPY